MSESASSAVKSALDNSAGDFASSVETVLKGVYLSSALGLLKEHKLDISFSLANPRAVDYFKQYGANLIKGLNEESLSQIKTVLAEGLEKGWSYSKIAKELRSVFGDWDSFTNIEKHRIRTRAQLIAVTEVGNAYQAGNLAIMQEGQSTGLTFEKQWVTMNDSKVDPHCSANGDQGWIAVDTSFESGADRPLDHPGCRCVLKFRRKGSTNE